MIKCEFYMTRNDGVMLVKTYSDTNKYIKQNETGLEYDVAIDIGKIINGKYYPQKYSYTETEKEIVYEEHIKE